MTLHALLMRQLKRLGLDADAPAASPWSALLSRVSRAYEEHDQERYLLERSQSLASQEMVGLYKSLQIERDTLDEHVQERTQALRLSESRLKNLLDLSADWIWEQDETLRFTFFSDGVTPATGIDPSVLIGESRLDNDRYDAPPEVHAAHKACVEARLPFRDVTYGLTRPDGVKRYIRVSGEPVFDAHGAFRGYRGVGRDVTESTMSERRIYELARYDSLTGLPNRHLFLAELERALARARRNGETFALCFIDLDRFKLVNDTLGHDAGDELLRVMSKRLRSALREVDLVARLGGDEFVVLLEGSASASEVTRIAEQLLALIADPVVLQGSTFMVTGSLGIGMYPQDGNDAATLLKHADAAMYLAKDRGKNNVQFYTAELAHQVARNFALETELRAALNQDELVLHYQPKLDLASGEVFSVEALIRWQHPVRGLVPPGEFIQLAEDRGLIVPIGRWVIEAACVQIAAWRRSGLSPPRIAVNLSARQFANDSLVGDFVDSMARHGVAPDRLEVELTESVLMTDPERANAVLQRLSEMGLRVAIDDFGTGYSSLSYLKRFPADTVKIDRSFVSGLPGDKDDVAITQAIVAMAHSLELTVVAEGVERPDQLALLHQIGCDEAQGYLLARPMPASALADWLRAADSKAAA